MLFVGDVHGKWGPLESKLRRLGVRGETIIQVGDFGVGFGGPAGRLEERTALAWLDTFLAGAENTLLAIRGNHDDPAYFRSGNEHTGDYSRIRLVPDYTVEMVDGRKMLFVGGALSIDRRERRVGCSYWTDEGFRLDAQALTAADLTGLWAVVTHSAPPFVHPVASSGGSPLVRSFAQRDPTLLKEVNDERDDLRRLYDLVVARSRPAAWLYGHFHGHATDDIDGTRFVLLDELEVRSA